MIGLVWGAAWALIWGAVGHVPGGESWEVTYLLPYADWHNVLLDLLFGVLLMGLFDLGLRLGGVRVLPLLASGIAAWFAYGLSFQLVYGRPTDDWPAIVFWALSGILFGLAMYIGLRAQLTRLASRPRAPEPESSARVSKAFFLTAISAAQAVGYLLLTGSGRLSGDDNVVLWLLGAALIVLGPTVHCVLVHRMWTSIRDGHARTTPGVAVGYLFIPLYNFYWAFQAYRGFADDFNAFRNRHSLQGPALSAGIFVAFCILTLLGCILSLLRWIPAVGHFIVVANLFVMVANLFVSAVMVARICDAVNSVPASHRASNQELMG